MEKALFCNSIFQTADCQRIFCTNVDITFIRAYSDNSGTKAFALTGSVKHTGLIEVPMGTDFQHTLGAFTTWNALTAAFVLGKVHEETGYLYHTGIFIHDYHYEYAEILP